MRSDGFVAVVEALQIRALYHWRTTMLEVHPAVQQDRKRRYKLGMFEDKVMIRCAQ